MNKRIERYIGLALLFLLSVLNYNCSAGQKYQTKEIKYYKTTWTERTVDKEKWGNQGMGGKGYFYPAKAPALKKVKVEKRKVEKRIEKQPIIEKKAEIGKTKPAPLYKRKPEGEKDWCLKKNRTVIPVESKLMVADFDSGKKPNNMGYDFGAWDRDPNDYSQTCIESFTQVIRPQTSGYSLQLYYDVDSAVTAYNGFWCKLKGDIDYSVFKKVGFWVKGDQNRGYTKVFKVELKNCINEAGIYYVTGVTDEWKHIVIPFEKFRGLKEWSLLKEFVITFEDRIATTKEGTIYIDDIYFEK